MLAPISGRPWGCDSFSRRSWWMAMPAAAATALPMICVDTELMPATSTTLYIMVMSLLPTYGDTSPLAMVDTSTFGTPMGSACMARAAMNEPPLPATASTASSCPSRYRSPTICSTPSAMADTAAPRSPLARSASRPCPARRATAAASMSPVTVPTGDGITPASTSTTSQPDSRSRAESHSYSGPLVSSVPTSTTVAMFLLLCNGVLPIMCEPPEGGKDHLRAIGLRRAMMRAWTGFLPPGCPVC